MRFRQLTSVNDFAVIRFLSLHSVGGVCKFYDNDACWEAGRLVYHEGAVDVDRSDRFVHEVLKKVKREAVSQLSARKI